MISGEPVLSHPARSEKLSSTNDDSTAFFALPSIKCPQGLSLGSGKKSKITRDRFRREVWRVRNEFEFQRRNGLGGGSIPPDACGPAVHRFVMSADFRTRGQTRFHRRLRALLSTSCPVSRIIRHINAVCIREKRSTKLSTRNIRFTDCGESTWLFSFWVIMSYRPAFSATRHNIQNGVVFASSQSLSSFVSFRYEYTRHLFVYRFYSTVLSKLPLVMSSFNSLCYRSVDENGSSTWGCYWAVTWIIIMKYRQIYAF